MFYYTSLIYPEKYNDFEVICKELEIHMYCDTITGFCVSPPHSADDIDKMEHKHVIMQSTKQLTKKQKNKLAAVFKGCFPVNNLDKAIAYETHANNPEKEQFPPEVTPTIYGIFDVETPDEILAYLISISRNFNEISDFTDYLLKMEDYTALNIISRKCYYFQSLFMSRRKKKKFDVDY